jgi:hypothetical protein
MMSANVSKKIKSKAPFGSKELQRKIRGTENGGKEACMIVWNGGIGSSFPLEYCASALIS